MNSIEDKLKAMFDAARAASIPEPQPSRLRARRQHRLLPDVRAISEYVPGYDASARNGFGAPKGTPAEIVDKLNAAITAGVNDPHIKARLASVGAEPMPMTPAQARKFTADEVEKWAKVIKFAHIKAQ